MTASPLIANARMYAVAPEAEAAWESILTEAGRRAGVPLAYRRHAAPAPLDDLWSRDDLGAVFMCGYPLARGLFPGRPIAAPIPDADWAGGRAAYRSHLVVAAGSRFERLEDTFGGTVGWTVEHSHSGFNALRHHLLAHRTAHRPMLYARSVGPLVTPRAVVQAVVEGRIDVGPVDAVSLGLMQRFLPDLASGVRTVDATATVPMPPLVASPAVPEGTVEALRGVLLAAGGEDWFQPLGAALGLMGFAPVSSADYAVTVSWERDAIDAGYPWPH